MPDCLIIGGGVIGLSLAYELAVAGARVRVIDAGEPGKEASWAGAGILPPAGQHPSNSAAKLFALSNQLHALWHQQLREETGIDNGYRGCGGIYLVRKQDEVAPLRQTIDAWRSEGVEVQELVDSNALATTEPGLATCAAEAAFLLPEERQIRNPRHLKALLAACLMRGVEVSAGVPAEEFQVRHGRIDAVHTPAGLLYADRFCVTSGAWSRALVARFAEPPPIRPVRGQIVLLSTRSAPLARIINEGRRYLVPRDDGQILVGSTEEDAGFDRNPTAGGVEDLLSFALSLVPALADARIERAWAGLRPASADGLPYLGRIGDFENAYLAAGHFRAGLQLSTGTALAMGRLMRGEPAPIDLTPFSVDRHGPAKMRTA